MKTNRISKFIALAMALAFIVGSAASAMADGITAPPKTREFLDSYNWNHAAVAALSEAQTMKCAMCKTEVTIRTDDTARGANKPAIPLASHLCKTCDTELKTTGVGKAAKTVPVHACGGCSVASVN